MPRQCLMITFMFHHTPCMYEVHSFAAHTSHSVCTPYPAAELPPHLTTRSASCKGSGARGVRPEEGAGLARRPLHRANPVPSRRRRSRVGRCADRWAGSPAQPRLLPAPQRCSEPSGARRRWGLWRRTAAAATVGALRAGAARGQRGEPRGGGRSPGSPLLPSPASGLFPVTALVPWT